MKDLTHGKNVWRSCRHKKRYCTYKYAVEMAIHMTEKFGKIQYVYWCPFCHGYHLTTLRQKDEREARILEEQINEALKKRRNENGTTNPIRTEINTEQEKTQEESSASQNAKVISQEEQE